MPTVTRDGARLHYGVEGGGETVALLGDAGLGPWQWAWQHDALAGPHRVLVLDHRGVGESTGTPASVDALAADLDAVLADADADRAHLVGFGLGGMVALRYAREFDRARSLVLIGAAASGEAVDADALRAAYGDPEAVDALFSPAFREARPDLVERVVEWRSEEDASDAMAAAVDAMAAFDAGPLYECDLPALVLHGVEDPLVPVAAGRDLGADLPRGRFEAVEGRRLAHAEHSVAVDDELLAFLDDVTGA